MVEQGSHTIAMSLAPKDASPSTKARNTPRELGFVDADFERASRGLIAQHTTGVIVGEFGTAWDCSRYDFIQQGEPNPDTVNPSLWRQAQLNNIHGLFEVAPKLWQARGYDLSNITFIEGDSGWVIIDPLTSPATAKACLELANDTLGERPVVAIIYTHSHTDHFGGVTGIITQEQVDAGECRIIAPEHFMTEAVAENVIAGFAMSRRAGYQFGPFLPAGPRGHVDCGLGKAVPLSAPTLIAPTEDITYTGEELVVDGIRVIFQLTPDAEAPAEMNFFFPDFGWLCMAENCSHTMHNLVPIRGAQARDSLNWSKYIDEAFELFGADTKVMFASHHWPRWGADDVREFMELQRDLYRWIHDQTMRFANHGYTGIEIGDMLELPLEFQGDSHVAGYYGHLAHNIKAVYQRYLSWYDGNPAHLWMLPPTESGPRYVALAGGAEALIEKAKASFDEGDYRWVAEVVNHLVFADPTNVAGRQLQADALEQLGYQAESATFRNAFLTGAQELRHGHPEPRNAMRRGFARALSVAQVFETMAVRLRAEDVGGLKSTINWHFTDLDEHWVSGLQNRALHFRPGKVADNPDASIELEREAFSIAVAEGADFASLIAQGVATVTGDHAAFGAIFDNLDTFQSGFAIVEP